MRKIIVVLTALAAAACGGSSSSNSSGPTPLTGKVGGAAFTPVEVKALVAGTVSTPCTVAGTTFGAKGLALEITSYANACGDFANAQCAFHKNAQTVTLILAKLNPLPSYGEPTIPAGTYPIKTSIQDTGQPDANNLLTITYADAIATDANCNGGTPTPAVPVAGGSLRVDQAIGATPTGPITGHVSVTFANGDSLSGDFSAALCAETVQLCSLATVGGLCSMPGTCP